MVVKDKCEACLIFWMCSPRAVSLYSSAFVMEVLQSLCSCSVSCFEYLEALFSTELSILFLSSNSVKLLFEVSSCIPALCRWRVWRQWSRVKKWLLKAPPQARNRLIFLHMYMNSWASGSDHEASNRPVETWSPVSQPGSSREYKTQFSNEWFWTVMRDAQPPLTAAPHTQPQHIQLLLAQRTFSAPLRFALLWIPLGNTEVWYCIILCMIAQNSLFSFRDKSNIFYNQKNGNNSVKLLSKDRAISYNVISPLFRRLWMMHECDIKVNEFIFLTFKEDLDSLRSSSTTAAGGRRLSRLGWSACFCDIGLLSAGGYTVKRPCFHFNLPFLFFLAVLTQSDQSNVLSWLKCIEQSTGV